MVTASLLSWKRLQAFPVVWYIFAHIRLGLFFLMSLCLISAEIFSPDRIVPLRSMVLDTYAVLESALGVPVSFVRVFIEDVKAHFKTTQVVTTLTKENQTLKAWEREARILAHENKKLRHMLAMTSENEDTFITAHIINVIKNHQKNQLLLSCGSQKGIVEKAPVVFGRALVGYVQSCGHKSATVMTILDHRARIPVKAEYSNVQAVVGGNGHNGLHIVHMESQETFQKGELLLTTSQGSLYPAGLVVGRVNEDAAGRYVIIPELAWSDLEYVQILEPLMQQAIRQEPGEDAP